MKALSGFLGARHGVTEELEGLRDGVQTNLRLIISHIRQGTAPWLLLLLPLGHANPACHVDCLYNCVVSYSIIICILHIPNYTRDFSNIWAADNIWYVMQFTGCSYLVFHSRTSFCLPHSRGVPTPSCNLNIIFSATGVRPNTPFHLTRQKLSLIIIYN